MKKYVLFFAFVLSSVVATSQHYGIVRKNYFSTYFDTLLNMNIDVLDSSTIRLGNVNPVTGNITNLGTEYNSGINLTGATTNPYDGKYIISSGVNMLTFDLNSGNIVNNVPITGPLSSFAFQNYRFNPSDSTVYGLVPNNFYSTYFDTLTNTNIQVLDSSHIRFASINPATGVYNLIGNTPFRNVYTLAGNSIDPHQMLYYYSAVDTFVAIDLYTGSLYSQVGIQLPQNAIFENFTYSCADTTIYGMTRQNYFSTVYDSLLQQFIDVFDSATVRLSKIDPATGVVTIISPVNLGYGSNLSGSCFIDPATMIYYFSSGTDIIGISLSTGLEVSNVPKTFQNGGMYFDMMRSTQNCLGALKVRQNNPTSVTQWVGDDMENLVVYPNPAENIIHVKSKHELDQIEVIDLSGKVLISTPNKSINLNTLAPGAYWLKCKSKEGMSYTSKVLKVD